MRCLVTGATGFVGSHLIRLLVQKGYQVGALVRLSSNYWRIEDLLPKVDLFYGDMTAINKLSDEIQSFKPDIIFHLAWHGGDSYKYQNDPSQIFDNLNGSLELLKLAKESGTQRWVGFGTAVEYGKLDITINEDLKPLPNTLYGVSKYSLCLLTQKLCQIYGIDFIWFRPFWLYGPYDSSLRMISSVILTLLKGEKPLLTMGEQLWDYLYVEDAVESVCQVAITHNAQGIFNLASGETHTIRSIVEYIRDLIDPNLPLGIGEIPYRPDQVMHLQGDISRLKQAINWSPNVSIYDGLRRTVEWFRENNRRYDC